MDPRKSATVTAPDLVKAFAEGHGVVETPSSEVSSTARYYVMFKNIDGEIRRKDWPLDSLQEVLAHVALFFSTGASAVAISVYDEAPDGWEDFEEWAPISAG